MDTRRTSVPQVRAVASMGIVGVHMIFLNTLTVDSYFVVYVLNCLKIYAARTWLFFFIRKTTLYGLYVARIGYSLQ